MIKTFKKQYFSLLELIIVIAIIALVAGVAISKVGRLPSASVLKNNALQIKSLFIATKLRALTAGTVQTITYSTVTHTFVLTATTVNNKMQIKGATFSLTNNVQAECNIIDNSMVPTTQIENREHVTFTCFPDGLISGPDIQLSLGKHKLKLHLSPLTGAIQIIEPDSNGEL